MVRVSPAPCNAERTIPDDRRYRPALYEPAIVEWAWLTGRLAGEDGAVNATPTEILSVEGTLTIINECQVPNIVAYPSLPLKPALAVFEGPGSFDTAFELSVRGSPQRAEEAGALLASDHEMSTRGMKLRGVLLDLADHVADVIG